MIRSNGKAKKMHFRFTGSFCTNNPRTCTPGGAARTATARADEGLSGDDSTTANRLGQLEQNRAGTDSGFRRFQCQRRTDTHRSRQERESAPAPGPQRLPPPDRRGRSSARFRRCFCTEREGWRGGGASRLAPRRSRPERKRGRGVLSRPKNVDEVAFQDEVVAVLKKSLEGADLPNLLFYGPPGTGKTSTILAAARELYGPELFRQRVLELNASDERGIQVIREKVKAFAQLTASGSRSDGKVCPPFKIVILDEADSMTSAAQAALRRTMEKESKTTRFCLICNYISRIIEPLTSRCSKFRFKPLSDKIQQQRLLDVSEKEHVKISSEAISYLVKVSEGDLRKAITFLQSATRLIGGKEITEEIVTEISGVIPKETTDELLSVCRSGSFEKLETLAKNLINEGYAVAQLVNQLHDTVVESEDYSDKQKSVIVEKLAEVDKCLADGADEYLQLMSLCALVMQQLTENT
ncbi:replication factor C subunit 4 isoform X1 [Phalacrocorax aristotelis]|uniref:replication factor C subunit 4 isoform X1 n=1 Tax=Phalacrocorax aristotelis TaxID=126867 RepID=UPI003F4C9B26